MDTVPEVVASMLTLRVRVSGKGRQGVGPLVAEGAEVHIPGDGVRECLAGSASNGGRAASAGEGEPLLGRVGVRAVGEGEQV